MAEGRGVMYEYRAGLERVVDGDTVRLLIDHGMYLRSSQSIRLFDVLAPEMSEPGGKESRQFVVDWFARHDHEAAPQAFGHLVTTVKDTQTFNRYIGKIVCRQCGNCLNEEIISYLEEKPWLTGA